MNIGATTILIILIICATVLAGMYIYYCSENEIGIFANPKYEKRISELEKAVEELKKKK